MPLIFDFARSQWTFALNVFKTSVWNNHRTRQQKEKELPSGVPEHIYNFPEQYSGQKCGFHITEDQLEEVADLSDVLEGTDDYLNQLFGGNVKSICQAQIVSSLLKQLMRTDF